MRAFIIAITILMSATIAFADVRDAAMAAISNLKQNRYVQVQSDEMRSIDEVFSLAENHFHKNELSASARYYLLTIQKIKVLLTTLSPQLAPSSNSEPQPISNPTAIEDTQQNKTLPDNISLPLTNQQDDTNLLPANAQIPDESDSDGAYEEPLSASIIGNASIYKVTRNDTMALVAAKLGVSRQHLALMNGLGSNAALKVGQKLKYNNRKIIPKRLENGIIVNIPDLTLYYFRQGKLAVYMPVALGSAKRNKKHDWQTPTGKFKIIGKQKDPTWFIPHSIRSELENLGKEVNSTIPPGPENPLGKYAVKTSLPGILIHSTTKPGSIYSFASHGCIRVSPGRMEEFFKEIQINTPGEIIYRPVKLAVTMEGRIFLEVHRDFYGLAPQLGDRAKQMIEKNKLSDRVDWKKVESVIKQKEGIAKDITL